MRFPRFSTILVAALALALVASGVASAQPGFGPGGRFGQGLRVGAAPPVRALQLTDEQRSKLDALASELRSKVVPVRDRVRTLRRDLGTELLADKPDEAKIKQLRADLLKAEQELLALRLEQQTRLAQILTPEQRKRLRERQSARALVGAFRGFGGGPLGPGRPGVRGRAPGFGRWRAGLGPWGPFGPAPGRVVGRGVWGLGWWWR